MALQRATAEQQRHALGTYLEMWWPCGSWFVSWDGSMFVATHNSTDPDAPELTPEPNYESAKKNWFAVFAEKKGLV